MRNTKKGFTLVELLVVIAILAILATVTVVGYGNFTKKAQLSNDIGVVSQLNTALKGEEAIESKNKTMYDAILDVKDAGYDVEKMTPTAEGYDIVWDQVNDRFVLINGSEIEYADSGVTTPEELVKLWKVYDHIPAFADQTGYSVYLKEGADLVQKESTPVKSSYRRAQRALATSIKMQVGLDLGANQFPVSIEYAGETAHDVIIRTNSKEAEVTIKNNNAKVEVKGVTKTVSVQGTSANVNISGKVVGNVNVEAGSVNVKKEAAVSTVVVKANDVKVNVEKKDSVKNVVATPEVTNKDNIVSGDIAKEEVQDVDADKVTEMGNFAGGLGTQTSPYLITNETQFANIQLLEDQMRANNYYYFHLLNDIDLRKIETVNNYGINLLNGYLYGTKDDGTSCKVYCDNNKDYVIKLVMNHVVLKDLDLIWDTTDVTLLYRCMYSETRKFNDTYITATIDNVDVYGDMSRVYNLSNNQNRCVYYEFGMSVYQTKVDAPNFIVNTATLSDGSSVKGKGKFSTLNCDVVANLTSTAHNGVLSGGQFYNHKAEIINCSYDGTYRADKPALIFANGTSFSDLGGPTSGDAWDEVTIKNIVLKGKIIRTSAGSGNIAFASANVDNKVFKEKYAKFENEIFGKENFILAQPDKDLALTIGEDQQYVITPSKVKDIDSYMLTIKTGSISWNDGLGTTDSFGFLKIQVGLENLSNTGIYKAQAIAKSQITPEMNINLEGKTFENVAVTGQKYEFVQDNNGKWFLVVDLSEFRTGKGTYNNLDKPIVTEVSACINGVEYSIATEKSAK